MIYGKGSKGNYPLLAKIALKTPFFPYVKNERSMLYIENLCEFVHLIVKNGEHGVFWPQNGEYSNTSELVRMIAEVHGRKLRLVKGFAWILKIMSHITGLINKAFGNLSYAMDMSEYKENYRVADLKESIRLTEVI
jgi:UDP-glucose 4-epimerase